MISLKSQHRRPKEIRKSGNANNKEKYENIKIKYKS